jgi:hypothetical protein
VRTVVIKVYMKSKKFEKKTLWVMRNEVFYYF